MAGGIDLDVDLVDLAVAPGGREGEQVLRVQLVGDAAKRGREVLPVPDLDIAAAGFLGDPGKARIRKVVDQHRLKSAGADAGRSGAPATSQTDRIDHHVVEPGAVDD